MKSLYPAKDGCFPFFVTLPKRTSLEVLCLSYIERVALMDGSILFVLEPTYSAEEINSADFFQLIVKLKDFKVPLQPTY